MGGRGGDRLTLRIDDGLIEKLRWQGGGSNGTVLGKPKGIAGVLVGPVNQLERNESAAQSWSNS